MKYLNSLYSNKKVLALAVSPLAVYYIYKLSLEIWCVAYGLIY